MKKRFSNEVVKQSFQCFENEVNKIFCDRVINIVVYGSAIRGDFIEGKSDIDFLVFVDGKLTQEDMSLLENYHQSSREISELLIKYIEGRYIGLDKEQNMINGYYVGTNPKGWIAINEIGYGYVESAMILDSYLEFGKTQILESVLKVDWVKIEQEIIDTINEFINNPSNDISWISHALMTSIRSLYTFKENGFISKLGALDWITKFPKYAKYSTINKILYKYTDHITPNDN
ncbi:MAG: nucleotidyltransferase domain-containing protein, partial [Candidatus Izemoplasma sp.]